MTEEYGLKHPYIAVQHGKHCTYGGNQNWFEKKYLRQCACGVIAANDLILYLKQYRFGMDKCIFIPDQADYIERARRIHRRYFTVIPGLGMTGFGLAFGLNRYFRKHHWKLRASWGLRGKKLLERMAEMLEDDIPVIMSIGPVFPNRWSGIKLPLYKKYADGYREVTRVNAHFVTATVMEQEWIRIASWGNTYYINKTEYMEYARKRSTFIFSNLIIITAGKNSDEPD